MENPTFYFQTYLNNHLKMSHHILIRGHHHTASAAVSLHSSILLLVSSLQFSISGVTQVSPPSLRHYFVILSPFCPSWVLPPPATQPTACIQPALASPNDGVLGPLGGLSDTLCRCVPLLGTGPCYASSLAQDTNMMLKGKTGRYSMKTTKKPGGVFVNAFFRVGLGLSHLSCLDSVFLECWFSGNSIFWL